MYQHVQFFIWSKTDVLNITITFNVLCTNLEKQLVMLRYRFYRLQYDVYTMLTKCRNIDTSVELLFTLLF